MGADNWAICPRCRVKAIKQRQKLYAKADKAYGVKTPDEYRALFVEAQQPLELKQTLREDYGIGVGIDGMFGVDYHARCECGFNFEYKNEQLAEDVDDEFTENATDGDPYGYNFRRSGR